MSQTILFSYFQLRSLSDKWFAFKNMGLGVSHYGLPDRMEWLKMLGSGGRNGFGLWPNWGGYALMAAFPDPASAKTAITSGLWTAYEKRSTSVKTMLLEPAQAHGAWEGVNPFRTSGQYEREEPTAVLTRARIKTKYIPAFWKKVRKVSESIEAYPERTFSVGVGELPVVQQATVSYWTSGKAMENYAYQSKYHSEVVKLTRQKGWYSEELFCRFKVLEMFDK